MILEPLFCPYCNARVGRTEPLSTGDRLSCPRCGESFAYRPPEEGVNGRGESTAGVPSPLSNKPASGPSQAGGGGAGGLGGAAVQDRTSRHQELLGRPR